MRAWSLGLKLLRREWRSGEMRLLATALALAVAAITSVGFFTDRLDRAARIGAAELIAADLLIISSDPIPAVLSESAHQSGLTTSETLSFRTVSARGERLQLVEAKAVGAGYPLRGQLRVASEPFGRDRPTSAIPPAGTIWADAQLMGALALSVGSSIQLGAVELQVGQVLTHEPDRGGTLFSIAPRLLMNLADIPRSGLVQPGSRVTHALLMAGDPDKVAAARTSLSALITPAQRIQDARDARPELQQAIAQTERFLGLASLASVLLAGVAIAVAARRHALRHLDGAALMRCLGADASTLSWIFITQTLVVGLAASLLGCVFGFLVQIGLSTLLTGIFVEALPPPSMLPIAVGMVAGLLILLSFSLPPLLGLRTVPPVRVLQGDLGYRPQPLWTLYACGFAVLALLVLWQARDAQLAGLVLAGTVTTLGLLAALGWVLVSGLGLLRGKVGVAWRFGLANIARRRGESVLQITAFGLSISALLLLTLVRSDLVEHWRQQLPTGAPNYFLVNVQPDEVTGVQAYLRAEGLPATTLYPMVRGRLLRINERDVAPDDYENPRAQRLVEREFNLSWAVDLPQQNRITAGRWWQPAEHGARLFSVEQGLADTLGITVGDTITFAVAGEQLTGRVQSLRSVAWDSFRVNFFVVAPPGVLETAPATYITSLHVPLPRVGVLTELVRTYPSVTVLDVAALLSKVRGLLDRAAAAVQYVFFYSVAAGLLVLYATVQATLDERKRESALTRTLGATRATVRAGLVAEFATLGILAGTVAALSAASLQALLATVVFDLPGGASPWIWPLGILGGGLSVAGASLLGTRSVVNQPPIEALRSVN
jgi:putative ABC transport system permease protein